MKCPSLTKLVVEPGNAIHTTAKKLSNHKHEAPAHELPRCEDCNLKHIPRRLVICVDGTWMNEDGIEGASENHASNVHRIWLAVREGVTKGKDGKLWNQIKQYFTGLGTYQITGKKHYQGITGSGFDTIIAKVYKFCVEHCCPSQDELFLFGYSRGAFIVRALAGLYSHMGTLRYDVDGWDEKFARLLDAYRNFRAKDKINPQKHADYHFLSTNTKPPPRIQFIGVFDTVKSLNDGNLYDISLNKNIFHVRHALALLENRNAFKPERMFNEDGVQRPPRDAERTCLEAWFLGAHANIGGACQQDGLALWPLQWILSEASEHGLFLEFMKPSHLRNNCSEIDDPIKYAMPSEVSSQRINFRNGAQVKMWDLKSQFTKPMFQLIMSSSTTVTRLRGTSERAVFEPFDGIQATIVHPSVHLMDDTTAIGITFLTPLACCSQLRQQTNNILEAYEDLYWNKIYSRTVDSNLNKTRVLVCGSSGAGKSSLINEVLGYNASSANNGPSSVQHDIEVELSKLNSTDKEKEFIFHDAIGFERGLTETSAVVQSFLSSRENMSNLNDQVHCIWYCCDSTGRISEADLSFLRSRSPACQEIILVLTKYDNLESECLKEACREYQQTRPDEPRFKPNRVPPHAQDAIEARKDSLIESRIEYWKGLVDGICEICVVSIDYPDLVESLCKKTQDSLTDDVLLQISDNAMDCRHLQIMQQVVNVVTHHTAQALNSLHTVPFEHSIDGVIDDEGSERWTEIFNEFRQSLQKELPSIYDIVVAQNVNFNNFGDLFPELRQANDASKWWKDDPNLKLDDTRSFLTAFTGAGLTTAIFRGLFLLPFESAGFFFTGAIGGAAGVALLMKKLITSNRMKRKQNWLEQVLQLLLVQSTCIILLHERLYWLGVSRIDSRELITRAAIDVLKLGPSVVSTVEGFELKNLDDFEANLPRLVTEIRSSEWRQDKPLLRA